MKNKSETNPSIGLIKYLVNWDIYLCLIMNKGDSNKYNAVWHQIYKQDFHF